MAAETDLDWASVKFVIFDTGSNVKNNLSTLLKFIEQRFVLYFMLSVIYLLFLFVVVLKYYVNTYQYIYFLS